MVVVVEKEDDVWFLSVVLASFPAAAAWNRSRSRTYHTRTSQLRTDPPASHTQVQEPSHISTSDVYSSLQHVLCVADNINHHEDNMQTDSCGCIAAYPVHRERVQPTSAEHVTEGRARRACCVYVELRLVLHTLLQHPRGSAV